MDTSEKTFGIKILGYPTDPAAKRRIEESGTSGIRKRTKKSKSCEESDDDLLYPEDLLSVEVEESNDLIPEPSFIEKSQEFSQDSQDSASPVPPKPKAKQKRSAKIQVKKKIKKAATGSVKRNPEFIDVETGQSADVIETAKDYMCPLCNKKFKTAKGVERHQFVHKGDLKCADCGVAFKLKKYLDKHINIHHKRTEKCDICQVSFFKREELLEHVKKEHVVSVKQEFDAEESTSNDESETRLNYEIQNAIVSKLFKAVPVKDICSLYNITPEVVNKIWDQRDKFMVPKKNGRRHMKHITSIIEPLMLEWYNREKAKNVHITGKMLLNCAEKIASEKGFVHFIGNIKWLEQFKKKNNIYLNTSKRNYAETQVESKWKSKFFQDQWPRIRSNFTDDQIFMADEVGLYYNPSKSRERKIGGKKFVQGEKEDRLAVFLCTNMSGTVKRRLLVVGTDDPLKYSFKNKKSLPVDYKRNSQCYFTTKMFEEYVKRWDRELHNAKDRAVLILDRASIHSKLKLIHLDLEFLPWKAKNNLMCIKYGVYEKFRAEFRNQMLQYKIVNAMKGQDRNLTCIEALSMIKKAWDRTPPDIITKSFFDLGYDVQNMEGLQDSTDADCSEKMCEFLKDYDVEFYFGEPSALDMYLTVEEELLTGKGTNPSVFGGNHRASVDVAIASTEEQELPINTEKPETDEKDVLVSEQRKKAFSDLDMIRQHLKTLDSSNDMYYMFLGIEKSLMESC